MTHGIHRTPYICIIIAVNHILPSHAMVGHIKPKCLDVMATSHMQAGHHSQFGRNNRSTELGPTVICSLVKGNVEGQNKWVPEAAKLTRVWVGCLVRYVHALIKCALRTWCVLNS